MARTATPPETAVTVPALTPEELVALLRQSGDLKEQGSTFLRMRLSGGVLQTLNAKGEPDNMYPPRMVKGVEHPACTVRIMDAPRYYVSYFLGPEFGDDGKETGAFDPTRIGRPDLMKSFCRRWDDPTDQAADKNPANEVFDLVAAQAGKGKWGADIKVSVLPEDGEFKGDEPVYTLSLSTTSALDWRGTRDNPTGGVVSDVNFIVQLAQFAAEQARADGGDAAAQARAAVDAQTALRNGGVVAEVYIRQASSNNSSRSWPVIAFKPVHVEYPETLTALPPETPVAQTPADLDDIPF